MTFLSMLMTFLSMLMAFLSMSMTFVVHVDDVSVNVDDGPVDVDGVSIKVDDVVRACCRQYFSPLMDAHGTVIIFHAFSKCGPPIYRSRLYS